MTGPIKEATARAVPKTGSHSKIVKPHCKRCNMGSFKSELDNLYSLKERIAMLKAFDFLTPDWLGTSFAAHCGTRHAALLAPITSLTLLPTCLTDSKEIWLALFNETECLSCHHHQVFFFWMGVPMSSIFYKLFPKWICGGKKCNSYGKSYIWHDRLFFNWAWDELRWPRGDLATLLSLISVHRWRIILKLENFARPQSDSVDTGNQK